MWHTKPSDSSTKANQERPDKTLNSEVEKAKFYIIRESALLLLQQHIITETSYTFIT